MNAGTPDICPEALLLDKSAKKAKQIISAAVTPFTASGKIDLESASRVYEFGLSHGVDGFFVIGTMGEWALLTDEERLLLAECASNTIGDKAKLLIGITATGLPGILKNIESVSHLHHSHYTVMLPGGWAGPACPVKYMHTIADACDRPIYLYYIPAANGVNISIEQFKDIFQHPKIQGLKNSSGNMRVRKELLRLKKSIAFELYEGEEWAIDEALALGCDGSVSGFGSVAGKLMKLIAASVESGDMLQASELQFRLIDIFHKVFGEGITDWCIGQKYALQYMGLISSYMTRIPAQPELSESAKETIRKCIDENRDYLI